MRKAANDNIGPKDEPTPATRRKSCPVCGKPAQHDARPFCSKRCADVDLHRWLGGSYSIPASENEDPLPDADR